MAKPENLAETVARYGYAKRKKIKLYGKELDLVSDPINPQGANVFIDAREKAVEHVKRVQVPRNVVENGKTSRYPQWPPKNDWIRAKAPAIQYVLWLRTKTNWVRRSLHDYCRL